ncbi:MAG: hypothetical protein UV78_C0030G0003 [Parcubacteria group bacterium GW2011_GWA2_43_17]|nr:MAG: hypothetical protein UV78_C0030G0003 [Parcubacteria group bacterium GW2011_GWA2_43_17]
MIKSSKIFPSYTGPSPAEPAPAFILYSSYGLSLLIILGNGMVSRI